MDAVGPSAESDIGAGTDQKVRCTFRVLRFANDANNVTGQRLQFAGREVFFPKLDVIHAGTGGFRYLGQQKFTAVWLGSGKLFAVGDVVEEHSTE